MNKDQAENILTDYLRDQFGLAADNESMYFLGVVEDIFANGLENQHQYNFIFKVDAHNKKVKLPLDENCRFEELPIPLPPHLETEPEYLKEDIARWLKGQGIFFTSRTKAYSI